MSGVRKGCRMESGWGMERMDLRKFQIRLVTSAATSFRFAPATEVLNCPARVAADVRNPASGTKHRAGLPGGVTLGFTEGRRALQSSAIFLNGVHRVH